MSHLLLPFVEMFLAQVSVCYNIMFELAITLYAYIQWRIQGGAQGARAPPSEYSQCI